MLLIYSIIIILTFAVFCIIVLDNYQDIRIRNEEIRLFQTANIVADTYNRNRDDIVLINTMVKSYGKQSNARIIILDSEKEVIVDSFNIYVGDTLDNKEIRSSLQSNTMSGVYMLEGKNVLQLSVPIISYIGNEKIIDGAVLISALMNEAFSDVRNLQNTLLKVSALSLLLAFLLTLIAANSITKPIRSLNHAVKQLSLGHLGYRVKKQGSGEMGMLIDSFNEMSGKLRQIESNRKSFINSISHELKTPLTAIRALIDSLTIGESSIQTYKEYLKDIKQETIRMGQLVDYLLNSIKLEDISLDITIEDLKDIIEDAVKLIRPYAEKSNVSIILKETESFIIKCDKNKIKEVILNLLDNAVKYKDPVKKENYISISIERDRAEARLVIEDNGLGIKSEDLENIFNRGFRVLDSGIRGNSYIEGYGIGLSIVKSIIEKHDWEICVDSIYGEGSRFIIIIPFR